MMKNIFSKKRSIKFYFPLFVFFCLTANMAFAKSYTQIKMVFPFGERDGATSICSSQYQTNVGCCEPPQSVYQYTVALTGCCTPPNEVHGTGTNQRCCTPLTSGQNRWGQTESYPCGGYCGAPNVVSSYNMFSSCCSNCADVGGILAFQTNTSVCGTCCSAVPISCGNIGERVCEPGTGSAYCSQTSACNHPNEWLIGSSGEGGFTCCASCEGTRWGHNESSCGSCCTAGNEYVVFSGVSSCCPGAQGSRYFQTSERPCGFFCAGSAYSWSNSEYCCHTGQSYAFAPGATRPACCARSHYAYGTGTACCDGTDMTVVRAPETSQATCCHKDDSFYTPSSNGMTSCCGGKVFSHQFGKSCCSSAGYSVFKVAGATKEACCPSEYIPYLYGTLTACCEVEPTVVSGTSTKICCPSGNNAFSGYTGFECCPKGSYSIMQATGTNYKACCPIDAKPFSWNAATSCCLSGSFVAKAPGTTYESCCPNGATYYSLTNATSCCNAGSSIVQAPGAVGPTCCAVTDTPFNFGNFTQCCPATSSIMLASGAISARCCAAGATAYLTQDTDTVTTCCSPGYSVMSAQGATTRACCKEGLSAYVDPTVYGTRTMCCNVMGTSFMRAPGATYGSCCSNGYTPVLSHSGTFCQSP